MAGDVMQGWHDLFAAEAGAAATLAGLLFVAMSINLARILEFPHLPTRAVGTLLALLSVLVVSTFSLAPGQSTAAYGAEIGGTGFVVWLCQTLVLRRTSKAERQYGGGVARLIMNQLPPLPFMVAGGLLLAGHAEGVGWIVPGVLLSFAAGTFGAWVLLIEIQR